MTQEGLFVPDISEPSGADYGDTPLRKFWGDGAGYEVRGGTSKAGNPWQRINFRYNAIDVVETVEIWPLPTAEISTFYSDPKKTPRRREGQGTSEWEVLSESIRKFFGQDPHALDRLFGGRVFTEGGQPSNQGLRMLMVKVPVLIRVGPNDNPPPTDYQGTPDEWLKLRATWHDETQLAWQVMEVQGMSSGAGNNGSNVTTQTNVQQKVLALADGMTSEAFYAKALDDVEVLSNVGLVTLLTDRTFLPQMQQLGALEIDEQGVIHKKV